MTDQSLESNEWDDDANLSMKERRGSFLLVICILSWCWIGFSLLSTFSTYIGGTEKLEESLYALDDTSEIEGDNLMLESIMNSSKEMIEKTIEHFEVINLSNMVFLLLGGLAVLMMFNLKKIGFGLYIVYAIVTPMIAAYFIGMDNLVMKAAMFMTLFISIAFIIMYGVNLKRMNR